MTNHSGKEAGAIDIAYTPSHHADRAEEVAKFLPKDLLERYEIHSYRHAAAILTSSFPDHWAEIYAALMSLKLTVKDIGLPGGNESTIPKKFSELVRPSGWHETRIRGDLQVHVCETLPGGGLKQRDEKLENYIDGHKIDYVKGQVAVDFEWNSKDQTFDRDLFAFRTFHDCAVIGAGVMVTRSAELNPLFGKIAELEYVEKDSKKRRKALDRGEELALQLVRGKKGKKWKPVKGKYGASTTWMGKLLYRMNSGRHGSCPVLVVGIKPAVVSDLEILNDPNYPSV